MHTKDEWQGKDAVYSEHSRLSIVCPPGYDEYLSALVHVFQSVYGETDLSAFAACAADVLVAGDFITGQIDH